MNPGDDGGKCPRCDTVTVQIGYGNAVVGAYCDGCDLIISLTADVLTTSEAADRDFDDFEVPEPDPFGPDPMP